VRIHDQIDAAFAAWGTLVVRHRFAVALAMLAISGAFCAFLPQLEADNSTESFLRRNDLARVDYDRFREQFGQDERIVLAIRPPEVFDLAFLNRLRALHQEIEREVPYVEEITSLWNARSTFGDGDQLIVGTLMEDWPETAADVAALRKRVAETPTYANALVNEDATVTTLSLKPVIYSPVSSSRDESTGFDDDAPHEEQPGGPKLLTEPESLELIDALDRVAARYAGPDFEIHIAGNIAARHAATRYLLRDVSIFLAGGAAVIATLLFGLFRRASGVILPLLVVFLSVAVTYGVMALLGVPNSVSGQVLPVLLLCCGTFTAVHILTVAYRRLAEGASREVAISDALAHSGLAVLMASLTTAGGLVSFASAELAQVRNLGIVAPIGVMLTFVYGVTLLPALLAIVPIRRSQLGSDALHRWLATRLAQVGDLAAVHPGRVLAATVALVVVAGIGVTQIRFAQNAIEWFPENDRVRLATEFLNAEFGGASSLEVWIDTGRENGLHDPDLLQRVDRAIAFAEGLDAGDGQLYVGKSLSIVNVVKETHKALNENRPEFYAIPEGRALLAQELLLFESSGSDDLEELTDSRFSMARVSLRTPLVDALLYVPFIERIREGFTRILGDDVDIRITGLGSLFGRTFSMVNITMARSNVIALLVITPLMILMVGDFKIGLMSMIPNLVPIWLTLGLMGWLDVPIDNSSLLVGSVLMGLSVDDTIHFMTEYRRFHARGDTPREAVRRTLTTTGVAMLFTSLVLVGGFLVMTLSYMNNASDFGKLAAFAVAAAFVAELLVSPALMVLADRSAQLAPASAIDPVGRSS